MVSKYIPSELLQILMNFLWYFTACILTFVRFFPNIKAKHDYGMVIGILTFSLVSISELQDDQIFELLQKRVSTIFIGVSVCVVISILISPVWAGQDLHNRIALNIENLAIFLEGIYIYLNILYLVSTLGFSYINYRGSFAKVAYI